MKRRARVGRGGGAVTVSPEGVEPAALTSNPPSVMRTCARSSMPASCSSAGGSESQPLRPTTIPPPPGAPPSSSTMRPSRIRTLRSAADAAAGSWETMITVVPSARASSSIRPSTAWPLTASSSPVGSSASSSAGRCAIARHSAARWRSPPESAPGSAPARSSSPAASSSSSARRRRSLRRAPRTARGRATQSRSADRVTARIPSAVRAGPSTRGGSGRGCAPRPGRCLARAPVPLPPTASAGPR